MNASALLKGIDVASDHAECIPAIRRLVIDLALQGKLLSSESNVDAGEILDQIAFRANELVLSGAAKKQKLSSDIEDDEVPVAYLGLCTFARLGNIANLRKGLTGIQRSKPGEFPLVVTSAERGTCDHYDFEGAAAIVPLVSSTGHGHASIGRLHYQEGKFALGTILCAVFPFDEKLISARFLYEYLTAFKEELLVSRMAGTANVSLTLARLAEVPVPIVSPKVLGRVGELMDLCDELEVALKGREAWRNRLVTASLHHLNKITVDTTVEARRKYAGFYLENMPRLVARPEHVQELRQTIFNLAVRGLLVVQDEAEDSAISALTEIRNEKAKLLRLGVIPKQKAFSGEATLSFSLPRHWLAVHLGEVCNVVTSGSRGWAAFYADDGPKFVRAQNIRFGRMRLDNVARVNPPAKNEGSRTQIYPGDLLIVITGAGVTNAALLECDLGEAYVSQHVALVRPTQNTLSKWLLLCLMSGPGGRDELVENAYGSGKPGLNLDNIRSLSIPIPPRGEQRRILAKVDALIGLCDQIEATLLSVNGDSCRVLDRSFGGALESIKLDPVSVESIAGTDKFEGKSTGRRKVKRESRFMTTSPARTVDQLLECIDALGGVTSPEALLTEAGLSEDVESFYDLVRAARDSGMLSVPLGVSGGIRRLVDAD